MYTIVPGLNAIQIYRIFQMKQRELGDASSRHIVPNPIFDTFRLVQPIGLKGSQPRSIVPPLPLIITLENFYASSMRGPQPTRSTQRQSQRSRKRVAVHAKDDFYECPRCRNFYMLYHGSYKRHARTCKVDHVAQEEVLQAQRVETPTPEPYTPVLTESEMDAEDEDEPGG
jgi:hypothetical protein